VRTLTFFLVLGLVVPCLAADPPAGDEPDPGKLPDRYEAVRTESAPYRAVGNEIVDDLTKGDAKAVKVRLSPTLVKRYGGAKVDEFVDTKLIPYFAKFDKVDPEMAVVARSKAADGRDGFVMQYGFRDKDGERRSVILYLFKDGDRIVAENIVPGRTMDEAGRAKRDQ
jgi:hypothetical protein